VTLVPGDLRDADAIDDSGAGVLSTIQLSTLGILRERAAGIEPHVISLES
jgi:hypothetical protein